MPRPLLQRGCLRSRLMSSLQKWSIALSALHGPQHAFAVQAGGQPAVEGDAAAAQRQQEAALLVFDVLAAAGPQLGVSARHEGSLLVHWLSARYMQETPCTKACLQHSPGAPAQPCSTAFARRMQHMTARTMPVLSRGTHDTAPARVSAVTPACGVAGACWRQPGRLRCMQQTGTLWRLSGCGCRTRALPCCWRERWSHVPRGAATASSWPGAQLCDHTCRGIVLPILRAPCMHAAVTMRESFFVQRWALQ